MAKKRQIVLARPARGKPADAAMTPLGTIKEVLAALAAFNTAPDGAPKRTSPMEILHGPGMVVEIPSSQKEVTQAMVTVTDDEIAFPVLQRLCKAHGWSMIDLETGRSFG